MTSQIGKRGLTYQEAMAYVGVKRRTFDAVWRPQLVAMPQGACLIFDRLDLDRLFEQFKAKQMPGLDTAASNDGSLPHAGEHNQPRNGRPSHEKGDSSWAKKPGAFTPTKKEAGRSTNGGAPLDFASAASAVLKKRNAG
jgi:hypothetical protein